jgi:8-amino-7-oxononanoate synthase
VHPRERIEYRIGALKAAGLWRDPEPREPALDDPDLVDARSNDYLGLARQDVPGDRNPAPIGAGASRLVSGTHPEHRQLERAIASWLGFEECLVFSSGYAANVGAISGLAGPGETILSDALNHASIIDGCRLSRAETVVLPHRDAAAVERALAAGHGVRWVVTESYFGMDGDSPDLGALRRLCDAHGAALVVDEAHAVGVFGPEGRGLCAERGVVPDVLVGGMGKALGIHGGFVACSRVFRDWLWNRARSLVFSTAPSPVLCALATARIRQAREAEGARARLRELELRLMEGLRRSGVETPAGRHGPLFPVVLGTESAVFGGAARARELGVLCHPIRPPTVPRGSSRLRVTLRADMKDGDVDRIARALEAAWRERSAEAQDRPLLHQPADPPPPSPPPSVDSVATVAPLSRDSADRARAQDRWTPERAAGPRSDTWPPIPSAGHRAASVTSDAAASAGPSPASAQRWVVLGTGTGVGKTFVAQALVQMLSAAGEPVAGLKPIETGLIDGGAVDAKSLEALAAHVELPSPHPLYGFAEPVTPSRAARAEHVAIDLGRVVTWVEQVASTNDRPPQVVVETAGGVFSPLSDRQANFDLAKALDPATWVLVAANRLGVLHDVVSALHAMASLGRRPDWIILSAAETIDSSTASNHEELSRLPGMPPIIELPRHDARPLAALLPARSPSASQSHR